MKPQLPILLILVCFGSVGAVLFTPALPDIQRFFEVSVGQTQMTITLYLLGYAFGQLIYGPIANRFGRKSALYVGIPLSIVGSLLCAFSAPLHSFPLLVIARFIQACGATSGLKVSFTMVADAYDQVKSTKIISYFLVAFAIMPGVATMIGGFLTQLFSWQSCFYFLALFGLFALWLSSRLPETAHTGKPTPISMRSIIEGYRLKLKNQRLILSALIMGSGTAAIYLFAAKAPFVGISLLGLSPEMFGLFNLVPPIGMILGSLISGRLAGRFPLLNILLGGIAFTFICSMVMLIPFLDGHPSVWSLFIPIGFIYIGEAVVFANVSAFGLATAKDKSNASAMLNFINILGAVLAVFLSQWIYPESATSLPLFFLFFFAAALFLWTRLRKA